jgi:large subunit ribosomal protein L10
LTDYKGLDVDAITKLRRSLKDADAEYSVVKNSLLNLASEETDVALLKDHFKGPTAIALSYHDPVAPAKVISEFAENNEKFEVKIGAMDGRTLQLDDIKALSSLPPREVLLAKVLSAMNAVPSSFVRTLNEIPRQLLYVLQAIKDQKETE